MPKVIILDLFFLGIDFAVISNFYSVIVIPIDPDSYRDSPREIFLVSGINLKKQDPSRKTRDDRRHKL